MKPEVKQPLRVVGWTMIATSTIAIVIAALMSFLRPQVIAVDLRDPVSSYLPAMPHYDAQGTFRTADLLVENTAGIGHVPITSTTFTAYGASATQTTMAWFQSTGTSHVGGGGINEAIPIVIRNDATFDTTTLPGYSAGIDMVISSSRAAGANPLVNKGLFIAVSGGQTNLAIDVNAGTSHFQDAAFFGATEVDNSFTTTGTTLIADSSHDTTIGRKLTVNGQGNLVTAVQANGDVVAGVSAAASTLGKFRVNTQNGQDAIQYCYMSGPKCWSMYPSTGTMKMFEYDTDIAGGTGKDRFYFNTGGGFESRDAAGTSTVFSVSAAGAFVASSTGSIGGALNMNSHLINNVTNPVSAQDAATKAYVDGHTGAATNRNPFAGIGSDGVCTFDGVATPVCGATLSGSTYTMARTVEATDASIATGVTILVAGYPFFATGTVTGAGTAKISGAGNSGSGTTAGARSTVGSTYYPMSSNAGGAGGAAGASAVGGAGQTQGAAINEWPACTTARGTSATSFGCGGGGGDGAGFGGAGGGSTPQGVARGGSTINTLVIGRESGTGAWNLFSAGAGGGGGGSGNGACTGGGGGGGGAWVVVNVGAFAGTLTITAAGGNGANAGAGADNCGGGGGGAGGVAIATYVTASGLTVTAAGGTGGTQTNAGVHGGNGFQGTAFRLNLSGDGT